MKKLRKLVTYLGLVLVILSGVSPAAAATNRSTTHQTVRGLVPWTLTPGTGFYQCQNISVVINGQGMRREEITTKTNPDGSTRIIAQDRVSGTATDANGETYTFLYVNHSSTVVPASGTPIAIKMSDLFLLKGDSSSDNNLHVAFNWSWTYDPNTSSYWPPVDNFVQKFTIGNPYGCDPI